MAKFLICPPTYFAIEYEINPFMSVENHVDHDLAVEQWSNFKQLLISLGCEVVEHPPEPGLPDMVFTNNAGLVVDGRVLLSRFFNKERAGEAVFFRKTFEKLGFEVVDLPEEAGAFEGKAEAISFGDRIICSYSQRSSPNAATYIEQFVGLKALQVELIDPRFYHLDLVFCRLNDESAFILESALDPQGFESLLKLVPDPIILTLEDGLNRCGNSVVVDGKVIMGYIPKRIETELSQRGFEAIEIELGEFWKSGGAAQCLVLRLG